MARNRNTDREGKPFSDEKKLAVWKKGLIINGSDPNQIRKDKCGAVIEWRLHGVTTERGWEIDHIRPVASEGSDHIDNLQPLQWQNNREKADSFPAYNYCVVK